MEQDLEITAESVLHMVRTQTSSPIPGKRPESRPARQRGSWSYFVGASKKRMTPAFGSV